MSTMLSWIAAVFRWAWRARLAVAALVPVVAAAVAAFLVWPAEPTFRLSGLILQALGITTVGWGILKTRGFFGLPSVGQTIVRWFRSFPSIRARHIQGSGSAAQARATGSATGYVLSNAGPDPTVERRVQVLEDNLRRTISRLDAHQVETDRRFASVSGEIKSSRETINQAVRDVTRRLDLSQTGGLYISAIGALWILMGVILATASVELDRLVR